MIDPAQKADVNCRLLERLEGMSHSVHGGWGQPSWVITYPTRGKQRVSEAYLRRLYGDRYVDSAFRAKVLIHDRS